MSAAPRFTGASAPLLAIARAGLAVVIVAAASCSEQTSSAPVHDSPVFRGEAEGLAERFVRDPSGLGWVSTPFHVHADADRLGLRFDANHTPIVEARVSFDDGATWGEWRDLEITFQEGIAHNAHVDFTSGVNTAQLRFRTAEAGDVSFLSVESFRLQPEPRLTVDDDDIDDVGVHRQGLVVNDGVVKRAEWGARTVSCSGSHTPNRLTIHHTDTPTNDSITVPARVRQIQSYHIDTRQWCDVGYHFLIGQDGKAYQGRVESLVGAHVTGNNTGNMGISVMGSYVSSQPALSVRQETARIMKLASQEYGITLDSAKVKGHRDYGGGTDCPGDALYPRLGELIDLAKGGSTPVAGTLRGAVFWGTNFSTDINDTSKRIAGATVRLGTGVTTTTDHAGNYVFSNVAPGSHQITASANGYVSGSTSATVKSGETAWGSVMLAKVSSGGTTLSLSSPQNGAALTTSQAVVSGKWQGTAPASITVNGFYAVVTGNDFKRTVDLNAGSNTLNVVALSHSGAELARVAVQVSYEPEDVGSGGGGSSGGCGGLPPVEPKHPWLPQGTGQAAVLLVGMFAAMWQRGRWF